MGQLLVDLFVYFILEVGLYDIFLYIFLGLGAEVGEVRISSCFQILSTEHFPSYYFFKKIYVSDLQTTFSFIEIVCEIPAKAEMIIQRVVLNSRPGMYFSLLKKQFVLIA